MSPWSPFKLDIKIEIHIFIITQLTCRVTWLYKNLFLSRVIYIFNTAKHMNVLSISSERTAPCLTLSKDARNTPAPHGTSGFSHFFTPMCNRQRQAVSDGINSESEYSGGQWFLNHLCDWNTLPSSLCGNNTLVTQIEAETFQQGLCQFKKKTMFTLFIRGWQVI